MANKMVSRKKAENLSLEEIAQLWKKATDICTTAEGCFSATIPTKAVPDEVGCLSIGLYACVLNKTTAGADNQYSFRVVAEIKRNSDAGSRYDIGSCCGLYGSPENTLYNTIKERFESCLRRSAVLEEARKIISN